MIGSFTRTGILHVKKGETCQDHVSAFRIGKYIVMMILDGCSSAVGGGIGAEAVGKHLREYFSLPQRYLFDDRTQLTREALCEYMIKPGNEAEFSKIIIGEAHRVISGLSRDFDCRHSDFACTLILSIILEDSSIRNNEYVLLQVGDGFAALSEDDDTELITGGDNVNDNASITYFVSSPGAYSHASVYRGKGFDSLIISSDGLTKGINVHDEKNITALVQGMKENTYSDSEELIEGVLSLETSEGDPLFSENELYDDISAAVYQSDEMLEKISKKKKKKTKLGFWR